MNELLDSILGAEPMISAVFVANAIVVLVWVLIFWVNSIWLKNVAIVDIAWGLGFVLVAWTTLGLNLFWSVPVIPQHWFLAILTTVWGCRLSGYLAFRNHGMPEDKRYAAMRAKRGVSFWWKSLGIVFLLQGVILWVVSLPLQMGIFLAETRWTPGHYFGGALWCVGVLFETLGDWQLHRFKLDPANKGQVMRQGLWRYTRHPNYFGDFCVWWGFYIIANAYLSAHWTLISPLIMSFFLMRVSGVTLLEQTLRAEKPGYADYCASTNAFFPWRPRVSTRGESTNPESLEKSC
ncbi:MAG: DUF1295 domain-containing protein [Planctomycetaceae bacterium]